jgi:hypothetical protein
MATSDLTAAHLRSILHYDAASGRFTWLRAAPGRRAGSAAGCVNKRLGYRVIRIVQTLFYEHRLAWLYTHGEWPAFEIDHINGDRSDNRLSNLRSVTRRVNQQNQRRPNSRNRLGVLGVVYVERLRKFRAEVIDGDKRHYLGLFASSDAAHAAYVKTKRQVHEGCTI